MMASTAAGGVMTLAVWQHGSSDGFNSGGGMVTSAAQ